MTGRVWYESTRRLPWARRAETVADADIVVVGDVASWLEWIEIGRQIHDEAAVARRKAGPIDRSLMELFA